MLPEAILFDLDDTLYPERLYVLSGFHAVAEHLSKIHPVEMNEVFTCLSAHFERRVRGNIFNCALSDLNILADDEIIQQLVAVYRDHLPTLTLYPEVQSLLQTLRTQYKLGLLTDGYAQVQRLKVKALNLTGSFDAIVYSDDFGRDSWKPSLTPYKQLLKMLAVDPKNAIYIGDNPRKDFVGARQLGLKTVRITRSDTEHGHIRLEAEFEADYDIATLADLTNVLG